MADPNPLYFISASEDGFFVTFKQLKEQKFGDTVRITEIKTPIVHYHVEKAMNLILSGQLRFWLAFI